MSDYLPLHPLAKLFPPMAEEDLAQLVDDIAANGQREPIATLDGQVIDGRNRQAACERLGLVPDYEEFTGDDPLAFVLSRNLHRRHLTESQRAMVAASLVTMERGMNQHSPQSENGGSANLPTREAARRLSISERAVAAARSIRKHGAPALVDAIRDGRVTVHTGEALKALPDPEVHRLLAKGDKAVLDTAKALRTEKLTERRATKLSLIAAIAEKGGQAVAGQGARIAGKKFAVVYADPPWKQESVWNEANGQDKAYPYPTMTLDEICAFVAPLACNHVTDDALLFLWRTANRTPEALKVMEAMGFTFVTEMVWDKVRPGTGRWVIDRHEVLMIGKRGGFPCLLPGTQPESLYSETKTEHSAKPAFYRDMITRLYPDLPKLEVFGRGKAPKGWVFYGFEAGGAA